MTLRTIKRTARKIGSRLGILGGPNQPMEMAEDYYDSAFSRMPEYHVPFYKSWYYPTWLLIVDRLRRYGCRKILDVGCGPGQFSELVADSDFESYTGLDFSTVAIEMARKRTPQLNFQVADVLKPETYAGLDFDAIICMEVLEHIEDDLGVLSCFPTGTRCLITVPNFPWQSHVRHFESEESVSARYEKFFEDLCVTRIKGMRNESEQFYLLDGVRNAFVRDAKS
jgi:SAM-dependent methyltransferase